MKTKSSLPWFGSDASVAKQLGSMLDDCKHVTVPFAGGMSILPHLKAKGIVANDLHDLAINFYKHASGTYGERYKNLLVERCQQTLSHPMELSQAQRAIGRKEQDHWSGSWQLAHAFWAQCWIGRKGKGGTKHPSGKPSVRRTATGGSNATRLRSAAEDLEAWAEEFRRCEFTCEDFRECLLKTKDLETNGIYCDPPWFGAGDGYKHRFSVQDHEELCDMLQSFLKTKVVVRYGDCQQVRDLYSGPRWNIHEAASRTQANKLLGELWMTNFEVSP